MRHRNADQSVVFEVLSYETEHLCELAATVGVCVIMCMWVEYTISFVLPVAQLSGATDITEWIRGVGRQPLSAFHERFNFVMRLDRTDRGRGCGGGYSR